MNYLTAYRGYSVAVCLLLLVLGVSLFNALPAMRVDLTQDSLYTLGDGSRELVTELSEPITLDFYFSASIAGELPQLKDYAQRIVDLLQEYAALSPDRLIVNVIDPEPFSEAEDLVTAAGLQGAPVTLGGDSLYMGLIASREDGEQEVISFFNPERERFLEYDISQIIYRIGQTSTLNVKVISGVQMFGGYDFATQRSSGPWAVIEQLKGVAQVEEIHPPQQAIDAETDVLLIIHPQDMDEPTLYAIDQFVLSGGKAMFFVDPHAEINSRIPGQADSSELERLFQAWGIEFNVEKIVGDSRWGMRISSAQGPALPHVGIIGLARESMSVDSVITAELDSINLASSGYLSLSGESSLRFEPLLTSSADAMLIDAERYVAINDHGELLAGFVATNEPYVLAAEISGEVQSAFSEAPQSLVPEDEGSETKAADAGVMDPAEEPTSLQTAVQDERPEHLQQGQLQVIVVADVDLLSDRLWVQVSNFFGQQVVSPWASNGDLLMNAVENLGGSQALISLRSRGQYARPFEVVNELRNTAAEEFKQQEQVLLQRLEELEQRISGLTPALDGQGEPMLSDEQNSEIEAFEQQRLEIRKQLRQVQHQLNQSIDALELKLRWLNIGVMPVLLLLTMAGVLYYRRRASGL